MLYVYPDEATARENAQDRIIPMLHASPRLREYLTGMGDDLSSLRIKMAHLTIYMAWSGFASRLGTKPIRYLILDELDKYQNTKREAAAEALAEKRVITWGKRAIIWKLSTPTVVDGPIDRAFRQAEARFRYHVVCPACGSEVLMDFEHIAGRMIAVPRSKSYPAPLGIMNVRIAIPAGMTLTVIWQCARAAGGKKVLAGIWPAILALEGGLRHPFLFALTFL